MQIFSQSKSQHFAQLILEQTRMGFFLVRLIETSLSLQKPLNNLSSAFSSSLYSFYIQTLQMLKTIFRRIIRSCKNSRFLRFHEFFRSLEKHKVKMGKKAIITSFDCRAINYVTSILWDSSRENHLRFFTNFVGKNSPKSVVAEVLTLKKIRADWGVFTSLF